MSRNLPMLVILLMAQPVAAVEPRAVISGPTVAKTGTLVVLSSAGKSTVQPNCRKKDFAGHRSWNEISAATV